MTRYLLGIRHGSGILLFFKYKNIHWTCTFYWEFLQIQPAKVVVQGSRSPRSAERRRLIKISGTVFVLGYAGMGLCSDSFRYVFVLNAKVKALSISLRIDFEYDRRFNAAERRLPQLTCWKMMITAMSTTTIRLYPLAGRGAVGTPVASFNSNQAMEYASIC